MRFLSIAEIFMKAVVKSAVIRFIGEQLNKTIKKQIINNCVKIVVLLIAILVYGFSLFGQASLFIGSVIIVALIFHSVFFTIPKMIRLLLTMKRYKIIPLIPMIFEGIRPSEIVAFYIGSWGSLAMAIKKEFDKTIGDWLPTADELADKLMVYVGLRFFVFVVSIVVYIILFNLVARPLLFSSVGIAELWAYALPFSMAIDFLFNTEITQWIIGES